jgi:hypothetical protein
MTNIVTGPGPRIRSSSDGRGIIIKNQEAIAYATTTSTTGDRKTTIGLTPPVMNWLGNVARNFQYFRWKKLSVLYSSRVPTTNTANVTMGVFTDANDADSWWSGAGNAIELTYLPRSATGPSWSSAIHSRGSELYSDLMVPVDVKTAHMRTPWFIYDDTPLSNTALNQACPAFLAFVVSDSGVTNQQVGLIFLDYEVELLNPTPSSRNTLRSLGEKSIGWRHSRDSDSPTHQFPGETDEDPSPLRNNQNDC